jgi:hypothetical protein
MQKKQWIRIGVCMALVLIGTPFFVVNTAERPYVRIDQGASTTKQRTVTLYLLGSPNTAEMRISNDGVFDTEPWEPYRSKKTWQLDVGRGTKRVYVQYRDTNKKEDRTIYQDTITYSIPTQMSVSMQIDGGSTATTDRYVSLDLTYSEGVEEIRISESTDVSRSNWVPVRTTIPFVISAGSGPKTVYVEFRDGNNVTKVVSDTITYTEPTGAIAPGTLLQGQTGYLFYYGVGGKIHPFLDTTVYHSWYENFDAVMKVSDQRLAQFVIGTSICMRPGTWIIKFESDPRLYGVELGCILRPIYSEIEAYILYGAKWKERVHELPTAFKDDYRVLDPRRVTTLGEIDRDNDGVPKSIEDEYGTRDDRADTDLDNISDYEEIYFWFTDPNNADTDSDGFSDGREILTGYSPLGASQLFAIPKQSYTYPRGTVVKNPDSPMLYYVGLNYTYIPIGRDTNVLEYTSNRLHPRFIVYPPFNISLEPVFNGIFNRTQEIVISPTQSTPSFDVYPL